MKPEDEMGAWTVAYGIASAILIWQNNLQPSEVDRVATEHADLAVQRLNDKERVLLPRGRAK